MKIDPKLISVSKCGKYVYPIDSVTGAKTFAPIEYFIKNVEKNFGGSVERFVKEYITRETKKYLKEGYTKEQIKEIALQNKGNKLPKITTKIPKHPKMPRKKRRKRLTSLAESSQTIVDENGDSKVIRTFPWTGNPDYFRSPAIPIDLEEVTKSTCLYPPVQLDCDCQGCVIYKECCCELKRVIK